MGWFGSWLAFGIGAAWLASTKNRGALWWLFLGLILGPLAIILVGFAGPGKESTQGTRQCPACAELVKREAIKCKHCGTELKPLGPEPPHPLLTPKAFGVYAAILLAWGIGSIIMDRYKLHVRERQIVEAREAEELEQQKLEERLKAGDGLIKSYLGTVTIHDTSLVFAERGTPGIRIVVVPTGKIKKGFTDRILNSACPPSDSEIWKTLQPKDVGVWVKLGEMQELIGFCR